MDFVLEMYLSIKLWFFCLHIEMLRLTIQVDMINRARGGDHRYVTYHEEDARFSGDHRYVTYDEEDARFISEAIRMKIAGETKNILIPLKLTANGMQQYVYLRNAANLYEYTLTQVRCDLSRGGGMNSSIMERPVRVLGPRLEDDEFAFDSAPIGRDMFRVVFWGILKEYWTKKFNTICISTNQHMPTTMMNFFWDVRMETGWDVYPAPVPQRFCIGFNGHGAMANIEIGFLAICLPESGPTSKMMIPSLNYLKNQRYVAMRRAGNVLTVSVIDFNCFGGFDETVFIFPGEMRTRFPGFQFASAKLTNAEQQDMVQKPVLDHYTQMFEPYVKRYRNSKRMAILSCLHPRNAGRVKISILGPDLVRVLAKMIL